MEGRDRKKYRHKGTRQTTIKTVYGEVVYRRAVYEAVEEEGVKHYVYLLDETLELNRVGLISTNMSELLVKAITELSYRECAAKVSEMTGHGSMERDTAAWGESPRRRGAACGRV